MAIGLKCKKKDDVWELVGMLDESADLDPLLRDQAPVLKLNLRHVRAINSLGLRKLVAVMRALGDRAVECVECSPAFIEAVNVIPLAVGGQSKVSRIKSALVPMACEDGHEVYALVEIAKLKIVGESVTLPRFECHKCGMDVAPALENNPDDYFFFLTAGNEAAS